MVSSSSSTRHRRALGFGLAAALGLAAVNIFATRRAERRTPPLGRLLEVDGNRVHVVERGTGSPVVLIHGNGSLAQDWLASGVVERLAARHRVLIVERPGFGYTTRSRDRVWTPRVQAGLIRRALDQLGVGPATIVGHSWGTLVALAHALDYPEQTRAIALLSGYYFWTVRPDAILFGGPAVPGLGDVMRYTISPPLGLAMLPLMLRLIFRPAPMTERFREGVPADMMLRPSQIRASAGDNLILGPGAEALRARLGELACPVLLMTSEADRIVSRATHTDRLAKRLPDAEHIVVPHAGHMIQHIAPDMVADAVLRLADRAA